MSRRYLYGPVPNEFAEQHLRQPRQAGACLAFNAAADVGLSVRPDDSWEDVCRHLPSDWRPDFVVLFLPYATIPHCLWSAPVPVIGLAADWNLLYHNYRHQLARCDLVLTDTTGVEVFKRHGFSHVRTANLYGCGRQFLEEPAGDVQRDIDILFVGNLNPAVQRERLAWLGRIARLAERWQVVIRTGLFGADYRRLLRRSRIVFNRSIRGECNQRVCEALTGGSLLFQEAGNREVAAVLADRQDCVFYGDDNLEELLTYYLEHEEERQTIVTAAHAQAAKFSYEQLWQKIVTEIIEPEWAELLDRAKQRPRREGQESLVARTWQLLVSTDAGDSRLAADLNAVLEQDPQRPALANALGLAVARRAQGQLTAADVEQAAAHFRRAVAHNSRFVMARVNLGECLVSLGQKTEAVEQLRETLAVLDQVPSLDSDSLESGHFPPGFDHFAVEWERAAWTHAGDLQAEQEAKRTLIRCRLHLLLAQLTDELQHYQEAVRLRPDLPNTQALLGCGLARAGRTSEAVPHLRRAVTDNPFDRAAARALYQLLLDSRHEEGQRRLAQDRRLLARAAPQVIAPEPWFVPTLVGPRPTAIAGRHRAARRSLGGVIWEGLQLEVQSLALVNREICLRLIERGHDISLRPLLFQPELGVPSVAGPRQLVACFNRPLTQPINVHVRHQWPPNFTPPAEGHWVIMQPWEFGSMPKDWIRPMTELVDEVWTYTSWVRDCYIKSGVPADQVHVIPLGVDPARYRPGLPPLRLLTKKRFKFLFVGGTIHRKGIDALLKAYAKEFSARDDVCLVIKDMGGQSFYRGQTAQDLINKVRSISDAPEIEYIDQSFSDEQMLALYAACDCLVHPYRGEGFGLPIAEAMACGLPPIVTDYGAALDFCNRENAYLIPAREVLGSAKRVDALETVDYPWLAEPDPDALQATMRHVFARPDEARAKGRLASDFIRSRFTWEQSAAAIEARLAELKDRPIRRLGKVHQVAAPRPVAAASSADTVAVSLSDSPTVVTPVAVSSRPRVSLCMIVKNEEENLPPCLESAAGLFDEIIIADTGSTDRTKEVALARGAKVCDFPWVDSFAVARNESLKHATADWIFWLDADDRLDEANRQKLKKLFAGLPGIGEVVAYSMKCSCLPDPEHGSLTVVDHVRLFPNHPQLRWEFRVHEQILPSVRRLGGRVRFADVVIHHTGYQDPALRGRKLERDLRLLNLELAEQPDHPFTLFNLGSVYQELGRPAEAIAVLRRSIENSHPSDSIVRKLYALVAQCHRQLNQSVEALGACLEGGRFYPEDAELLFQEGLIRREMQDREGAENCFKQLLSSRDGAHFASLDAGIRGYKTRYNLGVVYREQGRLADAQAQWEAALVEEPTFLPALLGLAEIDLEQGRWQELETRVQRLAAAGAASDAAVLRARRHLNCKDFAAAQQVLNTAIQRYPRAVLPRRVLTHVLLQEGRDWAAAERALRELLALVPDDAEGRSNLAVLLRQQARTGEAQSNG